MRTIKHISRTLHPHVLFALLLSLASPVTSIVLHNTTIALPQGSSDHGFPGLLCTPTRPVDLLTFYLLNYVAHAATVLTRPGERADDYLASVFGTLLFPALGLYRGVEAILCGAIWARNDDLKKAARSGALCFVVRDADWRPQAGDAVENVIFRRADVSGKNGDEVNKGKDSVNAEKEAKAKAEAEESDRAIHILPYSPPYLFARFGWPVFVHRRIIHGTHSLPPGYHFAILPHDTELLDLRTSLSTPSSVPSSPSSSISPSPSPPPSSDPSPTIEVSATYNIVKAVIALAQSAYALTTLYRARGDQISQFGFAAFGLTVAPYAVMSIVNLLGNLCRPEYASLYMVESSVMDEARGRGGVFEGMVGRVKEEASVSRGKGGGGMRAGSVCACSFVGGEEVPDLRFCANSAGDVEARFSVANPRSYEDAARQGRTMDKDAKNPFEPSFREIVSDPDAKPPDSPLTVTTTTSSSSATSLHSLIHTYTLAPVPKRHNYASTRHSAMLLIPCHPPICRTHTSPSSPRSSPLSPSSSSSSSSSITTDTDSPLRYTLKSLTLHRTFPFVPHYTYAFTYSPSRSTAISRRWRWAKYLLTTFIALLPLLITGTLSRFQPGSIPTAEASTWRVFTVQWLIFGVITGMWWVLDQECKDAMPSVAAQVKPISRGVAYLVSASPAVGGYIVVGQMLYRYGVCIWVGD